MFAKFMVFVTYLSNYVQFFVNISKAVFLYLNCLIFVWLVYTRRTLYQKLCTAVAAEQEEIKNFDYVFYIIKFVLLCSYYNH